MLIQIGMCAVARNGEKGQLVARCMRCEWWTTAHYEVDIVAEVAAHERIHNAASWYSSIKWSEPDVEVTGDGEQGQQPNT